ncbi:MAG: hypothetical protein HZC25_05235 [Rhodospirillales bacterium]|nr:hypothetical protein [Rhodospirillales bacterium]
MRKNGWTHWLVWWLDRLLEWGERGRARRRLAGFDSRQRRDLGCGLAEIEAEIGKPFWRA